MLLAAGEIRHTADNTGLLKLKKKKKRSQRAISQTIMVYAPADVVWDDEVLKNAVCLQNQAVGVQTATTGHTTFLILF